MKAPFEFQTERLSFSVPKRVNATQIFERYASDPDVTRYLSWPRHQSGVDTEGFLNFSAHQWDTFGVGPYLIWSRGDGRLLGSTGLACEKADQAMTGYVLAKDAWGQGYATETLRAMMELACRLGVRRIFATCHAEHHPSRRVLEKCEFQLAAGWTRQSVFPNLGTADPQNVVCYTCDFNDEGLK